MKITTNIKYDAKTQKFMNQGVFGAINSEVGTKGIIELKSLTNSLSKKSTGKLAGYWDLTIGKDIIAWINNANYAGYWYNGRGPVRPVRKSLYTGMMYSASTVELQKALNLN